MRALILGGTSFIGPHVVAELAARRHDVAVFHRGQTAARLPAGTVEIAGDRRQLAEHVHALRAFAPDVVIDMTCMTEALARDAVEVFAGFARRLVMISSMDVYRAYGGLHRTERVEPSGEPLTEDAPLRRVLHPYRGSGMAAEGLFDPDEYDKIPAERVVLTAADLDPRVVRLPAVYGPGDRQHRIGPYLKRMDDGRRAILVSTTQARWRWTQAYVEDVAHGIVLAATRDEAPSRIYHLGPTETPDVATWIAAIGRAARWRGRVVAVPDDVLPAHLRMAVDMRHHLAADTTRARTELGYRALYPTVEGLRRTIAWERAHPPAQYADPAYCARQFDYAAEDAALAADAERG